MPLPELFIQQIHNLLPREADAMIKAIGDDPSVAIRLNPDKPVPALSVSLPLVPWCPEGRYLSYRPQFTFDPLLHAGRYYVQDASSMIISAILRQIVDSPVRYLDLCAAPGGKSTAAIASLPAGSLVVANEIMNNRAQALRENIIKWGNPACIVSNNDSMAFSCLDSYFDVIAADVPCSGEGMMRKDDEAVAQWSPVLVNDCAARQREIIDNVWPALRPGGFLIYSTCTFNRRENEDMVEYITSSLGGSSVCLDFPLDWQLHPAIQSSCHCYRFLPHLVRGEGLFIAVIRKVGVPAASQIRALPKKKSKAALPQIPANVKRWISSDTPMAFSAIAPDKLQAFPAAFADDLALLQSCLKVIYAGCEFASSKGGDFIPSQALALSSALCLDAFPSVDIDYHEAIAFLRGEAISIDAPRGFVLVSFCGLPIGFVKNLGNRANNLYPKEWRIKSTHTPKKQPEIINSPELPID